MNNALHCAKTRRPKSGALAGLYWRLTRGGLYVGQTVNYHLRYPAYIRQHTIEFIECDPQAGLLDLERRFIRFFAMQDDIQLDNIVHNRPPRKGVK